MIQIRHKSNEKVILEIRSLTGADLRGAELTAADVRDLATEADRAGDESLSDDCHCVLDSWHETVQLGVDTHAAALGRVLAAIDAAS